MSLAVLEEGKYQGCRIDQLSSDDLWEAHRASYQNYADNNLLRQEKRRRRYLAKKILWQNAQAEAGSLTNTW